MADQARESMLGEQRLLRLLDVGQALVAELDIERLLYRVLEVARELTGARYAALGVLDDRRERLERFLTVGIDEATHAAIGDLPLGNGILGVLIAEPHPLRLHDVGQHPQSYGFALNHPPMHSFLGVPIRIRGEAYGNLYRSRRRRSNAASRPPSSSAAAGRAGCTTTACKSSQP